MGKRLFLAATLTSLLGSFGCLRNRCERHGYYPAAPACQPTCCVPCCQPCAPAAGYATAAPPTWNAPAAVPAGNPACCCPPPPPH